MDDNATKFPSLINSKGFKLKYKASVWKGAGTIMPDSKSSVRHSVDFRR